jgi:RNA polymerase-binding transcription factor DksA
MPLKHPHLDAAQLARLRANLQKRLAELKGEIEEGIHAEQREPAQIQRDADELNETTLALERLDSGEYGTCIDCGHAISWPRLEALPHAVRCITCEALLEKRKGAAASAG